MWSRPQNQLHHLVMWAILKLLCSSPENTLCMPKRLQRVLPNSRFAPNSCKGLQDTSTGLLHLWAAASDPSLWFVSGMRHPSFSNCNPLLLIHCLLCIKGTQQPFWGWHGKKIKQGEANFDTNERRKHFSELAITARKSTCPVMPGWGFRKAHLPCRVNACRSCVSPTEGRKYTGYCTTHERGLIESS